MNILTSIFKARDKPKNATSGSSFRFFLGGSSSGKSVTERSAMQMTAVYSCVRILAEAIAGLPLHLYRYNGEGGKEKATDHPLYHLLHDEPNPEMRSFVFRETLMTHLLLWGNAYAQIIRNGKGEVVALYPLMPNRMTVDRDSSGHLFYSYQTSRDDAPTMKGGSVILKPSDVLHIPGIGFDRLVGYSPIAMAKNAIGLAIATEEYGAKFFANGATPGGLLEYPGVVKNPERVRDSWNRGFSGSQNAGKVAILEESVRPDGRHSDGIYTRLYRYLLREDIYMTAYKNLYANKGAGTEGVDNDTADGFGKEYVNQIIDELKNLTYEPKAVKRVYIPKRKNTPHVRRRCGALPLRQILRLCLCGMYFPDRNCAAGG